MIKDVKALEDVKEFAQSFQGDQVFADPHISDWGLYWGNLERAFLRKDTHRVLGVYREDVLIGLFSMLVLPEEKYLELLSCLFRESTACDEIFEYIFTLWPEYDADFVFNPNNHLIITQLKARGAKFAPVQKKMLYNGNSPFCESPAVVPYCEAFREGYFHIHDDSDGRYWTAEKVLAAPERFRTFLAIQNDRVVGFIDVTHCFEENEPYDLYVIPECRRMGLGRALLARALEENKPKGMVLYVDEDNTPAICLYESMSFVPDEAGASQTATLII